MANAQISARIQNIVVNVGMLVKKDKVVSRVDVFALVLNFSAMANVYIQSSMQITVELVKMPVRKGISASRGFVKKNVHPIRQSFVMVAALTFKIAFSTAVNAIINVP